MIELSHVTKTFGGKKALDELSLRVPQGAVYGLIGSNGAGKSTLMNILYGLYHPTSGQIFINGKEVSISGPNKAIELGIGMVHQHFMLVQPFTVAEFFPTPGLSDYYDPRQHAIALCYVVPIAGDCKPQDETLDVEWVDPSGDMLDTFVGQMANGYGTIVRQALAWTGK